MLRIYQRMILPSRESSLVENEAGWLTRKQAITTYSNMCLGAEVGFLTQPRKLAESSWRRKDNQIPLAIIASQQLQSLVPWTIFIVSKKRGYFNVSWKVLLLKAYGDSKDKYPSGQHPSQGLDNVRSILIFKALPLTIWTRIRAHTQCLLTLPFPICTVTSEISPVLEIKYLKVGLVKIKVEFYHR